MRKESKPIGYFMLMSTLILSLSGCGMDEAVLHTAETEVSTDIVVHEHDLVIPGLEEVFELFFMADTHISLCDDRDSEVMEKSASRYEMFRSKNGVGAEISFQDMVEYVSDEEPDLLIMGGDILDSAMWASVDHVTEILNQQEFPWIYEMGNHDFEYGTEYFSEKCYSEYLPRLLKISETKAGWQQIEYDDFIVFAVDDKNNQVSEEALTAFEGIYDSGKPIILISHVPLESQIEDDLWEKSKEVWGATSDGRSRVLLGARSCIPDQTTGRFLELIKAEDSPVKLVLSGHVHFYHEGKLTENVRQIVTGAGFERELVKINLSPEKVK